MAHRRRSGAAISRLGGQRAGAGRWCGNAAVASAIWQGNVENLGHSTVSRTFVVVSSLNLDGLVILPFIDVDDPAGRQTYISGVAGNSDGAAHISLLGKNIFGFEDLARGGDNDFNDLIAAVRSISLI